MRAESEYAPGVLWVRLGAGRRQSDGGRARNGGRLGGIGRRRPGLEVRRFENTSRRRQGVESRAIRREPYPAYRPCGGGRESQIDRGASNPAPVGARRTGGRLRREGERG